MKAFKSLMMMMIAGLLSTGLFAQTVEDVGAKYNEGNEALQSKQYSGAITAYQEALKLAEGAGTDADDLKQNIEKNLTTAYYKNGLTLYKAKKYDDAIADLEKSYEMADASGDEALKNKLVIYIAKVRSTKGNSLLKADKLDEAFSEYEQALEIKPNCVNAFYGEGLVFKEKGDMAKMMESMDKAIEFGIENPKAAKTVGKAKKVSAKALVNEAARELQKEHASAAIKYINDSFKYAPGDANTYYYLTIAYNKTKAYDKAVEAARKAISLQDGDKSDIYFELGQALESKGDTAGACDAYKKVTTGPNVDAAKYQMTQTLKCS